MVDEKNGNPLSDEQSSNIPDWMREAGWGNDTGAFDESKPVFDDLEGEEEIVPADIPAWLEEAAPEGFNLDADLSEGSDDTDSVKALIDDDFISPQEDESSIDLSTDGQLAQEEKPASIDEPELDVPSWLKNLELDEDSQETAVAWLENMPESLRATEEELEQARRQEPEFVEEPEIIKAPEDELSWMDELPETKDDPDEQAELSEDLVSAELIPEEQAGEKLYGTEELQSFKTDSPEWLDELSGDDLPHDTDPTTDKKETPAIEQDSTSDRSLMPDWLSELNEVSETDEAISTSAAQESADQSESSDEELPDWLGDLKTEKSEPEPANDSPSLAWLERLAEKQGAPEEELITSPEEREQAEHPAEINETAIPEPKGDSLTEFPTDDPLFVSPNDDTLSTAIPNWLSKIDETETEGETEEPPQSPSEFEKSATWLEQLEEQPTGELQQEDPARDSEVLEWLDGMDEPSLESPSSTDEIDESPAPVLETAKYFEAEAEAKEEAEKSEEMPDWLSELDGSDEQDSSLDSALRQSGHALSEEEIEFIEQKEVAAEDNADWLAKLDLVDDKTTKDSDSPAIVVEMPKEGPDPSEEPYTEEAGISGGILDRLKDTGTIGSDPEVPQWLENLKKEEDPQETAILWLKQFVEQGAQGNLNEEIKRYTDELNPGDTVPKWMDDLKNEEDPQTTAMLWLEKLSGDRPPPEDPKPLQTEPDEADWLTALEKEEAEQAQSPAVQPGEDFLDNSDGWLADLEIDEKIKTEDEQLPDWVDAPDSEKSPEQEGETPPWMKATSPLEGDFNTDELSGDEKEVEIPEWLAGYGEGELQKENQSGEPQLDPVPEGEDYTWVSANDQAQKSSKSPIDLNSAAISQLEGILGISYQVARGIIRYREEHGPYQDINDLVNVPEISDEQTIEILKPVVIIGEPEKPSEPVKAKPTPKQKTAKVIQDPSDVLSKARAFLTESDIDQAIAEYNILIKKKKSLSEVISDLAKAAADHPINVMIVKTLGDAYMKDNNLEKALEAYSKAEELLH